MALRTAVVPAAGFGTRILPATKAVPKVLLPLVDKLMIQHVVEEAVAAGISDVVIVTSPGMTAVEDHFAPAPELEAALEAKGRDELLASARAPSELANITFVVQEEALGLGHAVWCARDGVGDEAFCVLLPDELFGGPGLLEALIAANERYDAPVVAVMEMEGDAIQHYGAVDPEPVSGDLVRMKGFVEKPAPSEAPSNLGSVGRYVLTPEVIAALEHTSKGSGGEIQLTDAIAAVAESDGAYAYIHRGRRNDVGRKLGYVQAIVEMGLEHPEIGADLRVFLESL